MGYSMDRWQNDQSDDRQARRAGLTTVDIYATAAGVDSQGRALAQCCGRDGCGKVYVYAKGHTCKKR